MAKKKSNWAILPGRTKVVYDRDTGEPSTEVVSPWRAEWMGAYGTASVAGSDEAAVKRAISGHPFTSNPPVGPQVQSMTPPDPGSVEARLAELEAREAAR